MKYPQSLAAITTTSAAALALSAAFVCASANAQQAVQWRVEDGGNGHWDKLVSLPGQGTNRIPWSEARMRAENDHGHLATLTSTQESAVAWTNFNLQLVDTVWGSPWCCWLGGYRISGRTFAWVTGEPYLCNTLCGWPCESGRENALYTGQGTGPTFCVDFHNDGYQGGKPYYLVEWSADCNSDGIVAAEDLGSVLAGWGACP